MVSGYEYAELQALSNFSLLRGGSHPEELIARAGELGYKALAIADYCTLSGAVRAYQAAKGSALQYICATRLTLECRGLFPQMSEELEVLAYPSSLRSYASLCRMISCVKMARGRLVSIEDLLAASKELLLSIVTPDKILLGKVSAETEKSFVSILRALRQSFRGQEQLFLSVSRNYLRAEKMRIDKLLKLESLGGIPLLAVQDACYHVPERRPLQDVLSCIRNKCTLAAAGDLLLQNSRCFLKSRVEVYRLFRDIPRALRCTLQVAEICEGFSLSQLRYEYPEEVCPAGYSAPEYLKQLVFEGAGERYPAGVPDKVRDLISQELKLIGELSYEKYFLTCYDIVRFAQNRGILCQGRGAAANSAVCYCLGITAVDPEKIDLLFARFISRERNEPPDIDIDFEHERREEVIQYIYQRFGRERAALVSEVISYRGRSAIRDTAKVFGLPSEVSTVLAKSIHHWTGSVLRREDLLAAGLNPDDSGILNALKIAAELQSFPRHFSQHVGGFVISQQPLCELVPLSAASMPGRSVLEWDKDDVETLGLLKIDVLALGMLSCLRKTLASVNQARCKNSQSRLELYNIPAEDPQVYKMLAASDSIGVFQIESRAQMSMLPRLKPRCFYDLVIEVAIVRPGPIQGGMVHPYLRRRSGRERVQYPDERAKEVLGKTLGVPLFQEQAMRLAIVLADFTPGEAERLRRCMAAWKRSGGEIAAFEERIIAGMLKNGYEPGFAENCVRQIRGFSEYGFPESHAASFANLVYASAWLKRHYPAEFAASLINSQPMGFYAPAQIISDARNHGVEVRPVDVNYSDWDCLIEEEGVIRLGMRLVSGLGFQAAENISRALREHGPFETPQDLWQSMQTIQPGCSSAGLLLLARADAFSSMKLSSRQANWEILALPRKITPLDSHCRESRPEYSFIRTESRQQSLFQDYQTLGFSLKGHPLELIREKLKSRSVLKATALRSLRGRQDVTAAGLLLFKQRPGTARGVTFITLEDETGVFNLIIPPAIFDDYRSVILRASVMIAKGSLQRIGEMVYIETRELHDISRWLDGKRAGTERVADYGQK